LLDKTTTIEKFLDAAAAKQPTPGGGSAAALAGALAAALGEMVLNYSVGKKGLEEHAPQLKHALGEFHRAREMMLEWMSEDQAAYEAMSKARKMPADDPERKSAIALASRLCLSIPQFMATTAVEVIALADGAVEIVNSHLLSDLAVCAELAMATTRVAIYNVRVNLPDVADVLKRQKIEEECGAALSRATAMIQRVIPRIWQRASQG
jgi:formiminotetrahydrofolate cyclodeaminase